MNIKNLKLFKKSNIRTRLCALSLASIMALTVGCSNARSNKNSDDHEQNSISLENTENTTYLDGGSPEIYSVIPLLNGEKRGILLSDEPHPYESIFEKTKTKVYLSDENGNRLSENFDELCQLSSYKYLTVGGALLGDWEKVETDKEHDYFVGEDLPEDSDDSFLGPSVTLLDNNGLELCNFNGEFQALVGNTAVIRDYYNVEEQTPGDPNTYLYDYITGKKSEKHDAVKIFKYEGDQKEGTSYLIGLDFYCDNNVDLYSFYDKNLKVVATASEDEIENWYTNNDDWETFYDAGGDYNDYFKSIYQNINTEKNKQLILKKDSENQN